MLNLKKLEEIKIETEDRYFDQNAQRMMKGDIVRALVELITNADDSYQRINGDCGKIRIEILRKRKGHSLLIVRDRAEGMSDKELNSKIGTRGGIVSGVSAGFRVRGIHSRGAKDCMAFGRVIYESIKNNRYNKYELIPPNIYRPYKTIKINDDIRKSLHVPRGNGTTVTVEVEQHHKIPNHENLLNLITNHFSLRDINSNTKRKIIIKDLNNKNHKGDPIIYKYPLGNKLIEMILKIENYPEASALLEVYKSDVRFDGNKNEPNYQGGFLVKSNRGIHELTFFSNKIKNDPYSEYLFGTLKCDYIDNLMDDYEERFRDRSEISEINPIRILDPDREKLEYRHPFVKNLYNSAATQVSLIIDDLRSQEQDKQIKVQNEETTRRLKDLAKEASKFMQSKIEEFEEIFSDEGSWTESYFLKAQFAIIPPYCKIKKDETKTLTLQANAGLLQNGDAVKIKTSSEALRIITPEVIIKKLSDQSKYLGTTLKIYGVEPCQNCEIEAIAGNLIAKARVDIIEDTLNIPQIIDGFSFEKKDYRIIYGKKKKILLLSNFPSLRNKNTFAKIKTNNPDIILRTPLVRMKYSEEKKFSFGEIIVEGRKLGAKGILEGELFNHKTQTNVIVVQKSETFPSVGFQIVSKNFGNQRAAWAENVLEITAKHKSIGRYLGSPDEGYPGQDNLHFKSMLSEIIAENIASKILEKISEKDKLKFENFDVTEFYYEHRKLMNDFVVIAHEILLPEKELTKMNGH